MKMITVTLLSLVLILFAPPQNSFGNSEEIEKNLTGKWACDDGGIYYIRLVGRDVFWLGESADRGKGWTNVFAGKLTGRRIKGVWSDLPKGSAKNHGNMDLQLSPDGLSFSTVAGGEGFKGKSWWRYEDGDWK